MFVKMNHLAKSWLPAWIRLPIRRARFKMRLLKRAAADRWDRKNFGGFPLPPPILRYRVDGSFRDGSTFLHLGLNCAQDLRSALKRAGRPPLGHQLPRPTPPTAVTERRCGANTLSGQPINKE